MRTAGPSDTQVPHSSHSVARSARTASATAFSGLGVGGKPSQEGSALGQIAAGCRLVRPYECLRTVLANGDHTGQIVHRTGPVVVVWSGGVSRHDPALRAPAPCSQRGHGNDNQRSAPRLHPDGGEVWGRIGCGGRRGAHAVSVPALTDNARAAHCRPARGTARRPRQPTGTQTTSKRRSSRLRPAARRGGCPASVRRPGRDRRGRLVRYWSGRIRLRRQSWREVLRRSRRVAQVQRLPGVERSLQATDLSL